MINCASHYFIGVYKSYREIFQAPPSALSVRNRMAVVLGDKMLLESNLVRFRGRFILQEVVI